MLDLSVRHLPERGYSTVDSVIKSKNSDQLIKEAIGNVESQFPKLLKLEMMCYHIHALREQLLPANK